MRNEKRPMQLEPYRRAMIASLALAPLLPRMAAA